MNLYIESRTILPPNMLAFRGRSQTLQKTTSLFSLPFFLNENGIRRWSTSNIWYKICSLCFSCTFKWLPGPWEGCSATCGSFGMQMRQLYCVHSEFNGTEVNKNNELEVYRTMVQPSICKTSSTPLNNRECNRIPCPGHWIFTNWSSVNNCSIFIL